MHIHGVLSALIVVGLLTACESPTGTSSDLVNDPASKMAYQMSDDAAFLSKGAREMHQGLATLRRATARYHRHEVALGDEFSPVAPCQENPVGPGGLGIPHLNLDRLDATIDLMNPEVLFYEPQKNGKLRLVGVETVVPIDLWGEDEPPSLFGQEFHRNDDVGLFGLHIWIWRHNSDGTLAFWHPDVSCEFAE